jgi:heat-inducible transcriptional repressor
MPDLTARQETILGLTVQEFIANKQPVGSQYLVVKFDLPMSSATVRSEMAALEELGYLDHPHTSAGRIPTEEGYRYFVQRLIGDTYLPVREQRMIRHQFHQTRLDIEQWMRLAAAVLARTARSAALVTAPHMHQSRFKHIELISTQGPVVLLVLVLGSGEVLQQMLTLAQSFFQEELSQSANRLNNACYGLSAREIEVAFSSLPVLEREVGLIIRDMMSRADERVASRVFQDGLSNLFELPDLERADTISQGIRLLEERTFLEEVLRRSLNMTQPSLDTGGETVRVLIAGEGRWEELKDWSMVLARYGLSGYAVGALGVFGPTHMHYGRAISAVRYVAGLMTELMRQLYGYESPN